MSVVGIIWFVMWCDLIKCYFECDLWIVFEDFIVIYVIKGKWFVIVKMVGFLDIVFECVVNIDVVLVMFIWVVWDFVDIEFRFVV